MNEMKSLTLNGKTYDSFPDKKAVKTINGKTPDENGNVEITIPESGGNVGYVEPMEDDIPKVFISGVKPTTKDDVLAEMRYISKTDDFYAYLKIKCQGASSLSYPKKNFTIKMYADEARGTKLKKAFKEWGFEENKFVLKANWIDHSHARNIVSARIWDEIVRSRPNYDDLPVEMRTSHNSGAIDGFPVKLYYNGTYEGLYTWNYGKDPWMWNMDDDNPNHALLCCCYNDNGVLLNKAGNFRALWSGVHEDNWDIEVGTQGATLTNSLNVLISCVKDTDDETFKATIGNYLDIESALDYYLYFWANAGLDSLENNMMLASYDGAKWICGAYDMDSVWGLFFNGSKFIATDFKCPDQYQAPYSLLWERITKLFIPELKARYAELRSGVLSYPNIVTHFERFMDVISSDLYAEDLTIYTDIPSGSTNNIKQIRNYVRDRLSYVDTEVEALGQEDVEIPCTGISLSASELTFTAIGSQTLTATVTPEDTTDAIVWNSNTTSVATVSGGVVTAVGNGSATITATCGNYSASCSVSVSGIGEVNTIALVSGKALNNQGVEVTYSGTYLSDFVAVNPELAYSIVNTNAEFNTVDVYGYDANKNVLRQLLRGGDKSATIAKYPIPVCDDVKYMRICIYSANVIEAVEVEEIAYNSENVSVNLVSGYNIYTLYNEIYKGVVFLESGCFAMPYFYPIEANSNYTIDFGDNAKWPGAHAYDADYAYLGEISGTVSGGTITFTTHENTAYLRWACAGTPTNPITLVKN